MEQKEARRRNQRRFQIEFLIGFLVSIAVFVVLTFTFLMPLMANFQFQISKLTDRVTILQNRVAELSSALEPESEEAGEASADAAEPPVDADPAVPPATNPVVKVPRKTP